MGINELDCALWAGTRFLKKEGRSDSTTAKLLSTVYIIVGTQETKEHSLYNPLNPPYVSPSPTGIRLRSTFSRQSVLSIVSASAIRAMMTKTTLLLVATLVIVVAARSPVAAQPPPAEAKAVITVTNLSPVEVLLFQILAGKLNPMDTVPANTSQFMIRNFQAVDGQVDLLVQSTALGVTSQVGRVLTLSNVTNIVVRVNSAATGLVATITGLLNGPVSVALDLIFDTIVGALTSTSSP
ncbi:hypothetical protein MPTK1_8g09570 [Marchantia polymorpha subsp. ruderalis]|uniref:Uncharacterized protein n=1 Tax=Marchantia polymorpha TaxID=3197 RepID=A0A2R6XNC2_MARPO|nr:hypothetical protein MARPO_0008s0267 [Marchantia polymorpha]BBN19310.1 hypothetical protein Mp_8g09570 [Marchantia polymorpha subsp. ruderalis]|eukprot:PTQ47526.1 hypothetical protein MARPO_0008s0267 [Marchantia polymorpha]